MADRTQTGTFNNNDGSVTLKSKSDKNQVEAIADKLDAYLHKIDHQEGLLIPWGDKERQEVHQLRGYCEQLRIISDRMK